MFERVGLGNRQTFTGWFPRREECGNSVVQSSHRMDLAFDAIAESSGGKISTAISHPIRVSQALRISTTRTKDFVGVRALYLQDSYTPYTQLILSDPGGSRVFLSSG